jgi:hypothetical protein
MTAVQALDRIAAAVATVGQMPAAMITVVHAGEHVLAAGYGLDTRTAAGNGHLATPLALCREVTSGRPILMQDARRLRRGGPAGDAAIAGYGGVPIIADDRSIIGTLAAFGPAPRNWHDRDLIMLRSFAEVAAVLLPARGLAPRRAVPTPTAEPSGLPDRDAFLAHGNDLIARVRSTGVPGIVVALELYGRDAARPGAREDLVGAAAVVVRACFHDHAVVGRLGALQLGVVALGVAAAGTPTVIARLAAEMALANSRRPPGMQLGWRVGIVAIGTAATGDLGRLLIAADHDRALRSWSYDNQVTTQDEIILG